MERSYRYYLPPEQVPILQKPLEELTGENLTSQEVFLVSRINGTWSVKNQIRRPRFCTWTCTSSMK